jgi:hypothetical protein
MHNLPLALALSLSLVAGYAGVRVAMPPQPATELLETIAERCRAYEMLHRSLHGARAAEEFARRGDCSAALLKHLR